MCTSGFNGPKTALEKAKMVRVVMGFIFHVLTLDMEGEYQPFRATGPKPFFLCVFIKIPFFNSYCVCPDQMPYFVAFGLYLHYLSHYLKGDARPSWLITPQPLYKNTTWF